MSGSPGGRGAERRCRSGALLPGMPVVSIAESGDCDSGYLGWVAAQRDGYGDGYVVSIGRRGRGYGRLYRAGCPAITSRPSFT